MQLQGLCIIPDMLYTYKTQGVDVCMVVALKGYATEWNLLCYQLQADNEKIPIMIVLWMAHDEICLFGKA